MRHINSPSYKYLATYIGTALGTIVDISIDMRLLGAACLFMILWGITADAREARSCSASFKTHRVFKGHSTERSAVLKDTLNSACQTGLSDSQIAGRVLKSCMKSCDAPTEVTEYDVVESLLLDESEKPKAKTASDGAKCKQTCFSTLQKMAKETQRLKHSNTARR